MTRDEFESRYRLLQQVTRAGEAETHHALGPAGAVVMVHFLAGELATRVRALLAGPESARPDRILETVEVEGSPVLITKFIMDFEGLATWLEAEGVSPAPPPPDGGGSGSEPGELTRRFAAGGGLQPADASDTSDGPAAGAGGAGLGAGEDAEAPPGGDTPDHGVAPEETPPGAEVDTPGEFTRLFRARTPDGGLGGKAGPEGDVEAEAPPGAGASGSGSAPETVDPPRHPSAGGDDIGEAGEFTRLFEVPPEVVRPPETPPTSETRRPSPPPSTPHPSPPPVRPAKPTPPPPPPPPEPAAERPRTEPPGEQPPAARRGPEAAPSDVPEPRYGADAEPEPGAADPPSRPEPGELTSRFAARPTSSTPDHGSERDRWSFSGDDEAAAGEDTVADDYLDRLYEASPPGGRAAERGSGAVGPGPPPPPPGGSSGGGGGDRGPSPYTRVISGMEVPQADRSTPPPPAAARSAGTGSGAGGAGGDDGPSLWPFLLGIALVVLLATALVVGYVLITSREATPEATDPGATPEPGDSVALVTGSRPPIG